MIDASTLSAVKSLHMTCAALSFTGFFLRGLWMLQQSTRLQQRWVKTLPHIIDALLLGSAIVLAVGLHFSPLHHPWLATKIVALLLYIGLGMVALRFGSTLRVRGIAWVLALLTFVHIVGVAITKSPLGYFSHLVT